jgi:enoyl-CoA hydratase/carnithine racemase
MAELMIRREGAVGWIVFSNTARHNALTFDMWRALPPALAEFSADPQVRAVVLAGDGDKAFVSGADISQFESTRGTDEGELEYKRAVEEAFLAPVQCAKPVIAKIRGICMGGGLGLAAACDIRMAADDAIFRMPAARLGIGYGFAGMQRFVQIIGPLWTSDIFFSARKFDAQDALRMGFLRSVFSVADLDREVGAYCATIAENAPLSLMAAKAAIREVLNEPNARDMHALEKLIDACAPSEDHREGRDAFMQKRTPNFQGR